jgi:hypothetical protein
MAIRDRIMSSNMRQPFREDVLRPMPVPMPMPILPPAPRQPLPLPMLPPVMPPRREDFLSIQRLDDLIVRPSPVGPSIPFVPSQDLPLPPGPILPPRGRPIPPISIGGIVGGKPMLKVPGGGGINYGIPDSFTPLPGSANERESIIPPPIDLRPPRPLQPIDIPAPVLPDPRDTIGKPLPPIPLEDFGLGPGRRIPPMATPADFIPRNDKTTGYDELQEKIGGSRLRFPPPQDVPPIPLEDFGLGPGIRPTEIRDEQGNIIVGSGGVTPEREPEPFVPPQQPPRVPLSERTDVYGAGKRFDPANLPEGFSFQDTSGMIRATVMPPAGFVYAYGPDGEQITVPSGEPGAAEMRDQGAARDQAFLDFQKTNPGEVFFGGLRPPTDPIVEPDSTPDPTPDPVTTPAPVTPPEPVTPPASTTVAANQPTETPVTDPAQTTAPVNVSNQSPFAASVTQQQVGLDPLTEQLLFGIGGQGGFIPGAMRAAEKVFYDDQGQPVVIDEQVAGFSPDQLAAMQLQRQSVGMQQPFIDQATQAYFSGLGALQSGVGESLGTAEQAVADIARGVSEARGLREAGLGSLVGSLDEARGITRGSTDRFGRRISGVETGAERAARQFARGLGRSQFGLERGVDQFGRRLSDVEGIQRGATGQFGARTGSIAGRGISDVDRLEQGLRDPEGLLRGSVGGFDPSMTGRFFDPFEDQVVQQTIEDVLEQGAKSDIGARASDIARGGESAFGSRARLGASERQEALGRGLAEALGGIRSGGFQRAQQAALGEFARQKQAERAAASGLAGLARQRLGAGQQLTGLLSGLSGQQLAAQQALASGLGSLAGQRLGAGQNLAEFQRGTAGQQLASQQALQSMLRGTAAERLAAQQNLGQTLAGLGTTQQQALSQAGQQALAGQKALGSARAGLAGTQMGAGQALQAGQFGLGSSLQGLGAQAAGASASDIAALYGMGAQQQGQAQQMLDAQRRNLQQRQMTPLLQYQALAPFVSMAPAGQFQTTTQFAPRPSAMQTGIGTGLAAFGALGNLYGGN